jgi:hypothetical protein
MSNKKLLKWAAKHVTEWPAGLEYLKCDPEGFDDGRTQTVYFSQSGPIWDVRPVGCDKQFKTLQKVTREEWEAARLDRETRRAQPTQGATATLESGFKLEALVRYVAALHAGGIAPQAPQRPGSPHVVAWLQLPEGLRNRVTQVTEDLRNAK